MENITTSQDLRNAIARLELRQTTEILELREEFGEVYESFKVKNLIKDIFLDVAADKEITGNIMNSAGGVVAGYASKRIFEGKSPGTVKGLVGSVLMMGVSQVINKNPQLLGTLVNGLSNVFKRKAERARKKEEQEFEETE